MKRYISLLVALVALMLAACQPSQLGATQTPTTTTPSQTTKQTENAVLPTTVTPTETEQDSFVPGSYGIPFVYDGSNPVIGITPDLSECVLGYFYYVDMITTEVFFVCDASVSVFNGSDTHIFYVKEEEPNKIYATPLADLAQHTLVYESSVGKINKLAPGARQYYNTALEILVENRRFVWLDLTTGNSEVYMEQYYIETACVETGYGRSEKIDGEWCLIDSNQIWFVGKLTEDDEIGQYWYFRDTGEIIVCTEN